MDFYERVALVCSRIPAGTVATYGQIALLCGKPRNARQVGYALSRGLAGESAPAHRVVNARGVLTGAAAFETFDLQKRLLENEGVTVVRTPDGNGWQVDLKQWGWKHTIEDALELRNYALKNGACATSFPNDKMISREEET